MYVVRALISVDSLQVHHMPDHMILVRNTVAPQHVPAIPHNLQRLSARIPFDQGNLLGLPLARVLQAANTQAGLEGNRNFRKGVCELALRELVGRKRPRELVALNKVVAHQMHAKLGSTESAPCDAIPRIAQAAERSLGVCRHTRAHLETHGFGEEVGLGHLDIVHHDHASARGSQRKLAVNRRRLEPFHAPFQDKTANVAIVVLGPHHKHVSNRRVCDPA